MKKFLSFLLMICISISCCACGNKDVNVSTESQIEPNSTTTSNQFEVTTTSAKSTTTTCKQSEVTTTSAKSTTTTCKQSEVTTTSAKSTTTTSIQFDVTTTTTTTARPSEFDPLKPDKRFFTLLCNCSELGTIIDVSKYYSSPYGFFAITKDGGFYQFAKEGKFSTSGKPYRKITTPTPFKNFINDDYWRLLGSDGNAYAMHFDSNDFPVFEKMGAPTDVVISNNNRITYHSKGQETEIYTFPIDEVVEYFDIDINIGGEIAIYNDLGGKIFDITGLGPIVIEDTIKTDKGWYRINQSLEKRYIDKPTVVSKPYVEKIQLESSTIFYQVDGVLIDKEGNFYYR